jgi:hypothetical protein
MNTLVDEVQRAISQGAYSTWVTAATIVTVIVVGLIRRVRAPMKPAATSGARRFQTIAKAAVSQFTAARLKVAIDTPHNISTDASYLESAGRALALAIGTWLQSLHPTDNFIGDMVLGVPWMTFTVELERVHTGSVHFEFAVNVGVVGDEKWVPQCLDNTIKACETVCAGYERDWPRQAGRLGGIFGTSELKAFEVSGRSLTEVEAELEQWRARNRAQSEGENGRS